MKKKKSASYDSEWLRENSEKEYGLPYEEALEMSYDNLRVAYDQLTQQKAEFFAEFERFRTERDDANKIASAAKCEIDRLVTRCNQLHESLHKTGVCPIPDCERWKS